MDARKRAAQRVFSSGRFDLNMYDKGLRFLYFTMLQLTQHFKVKMPRALFFVAKF